MTSPGWFLGVAPNPEPVRILHITGAERDHTSLRGILKLPNWQLHHVRNCQETRNFLKTSCVALVLSEALLSDGDWKILLQETTRLPETPPLVVSSRLADERLWAEVLNLGGHDLVLTPFEAVEVTRVLQSALRASAMRMQPRMAQRMAAALAG